jgi:hypothetical protein
MNGSKHSSREPHKQNNFLVTNLLLLACWRLGFVFYLERRTPATKPTARSLDGEIEVAVGTCHLDGQTLTPGSNAVKNFFRALAGLNGPILFFLCSEAYFLATE